MIEIKGKSGKSVLLEKIIGKNDIVVIFGREGYHFLSRDNVYIVEEPTVEGVLEFFREHNRREVDNFIIYSNFSKDEISHYIKTFSEYERETRTSFIVMYYG
jgi:hypothetical protein